MADPFRSDYTNSAPAVSSFAVTPHDANELVSIPRAIFVGGAGNIVLRMMNDSADVTFTNITAGTLLPIRPRYIRATSTTATNIVALL